MKRRVWKIGIDGKEGRIMEGHGRVDEEATRRSERNKEGI